MKTIFKYTLSSVMNLPKGAEILSIQIQDGQPMVWALVDQDVELETRLFDKVGTGWHVEDNTNYITTYQEGIFVWHIFERFINPNN